MAVTLGAVRTASGDRGSATLWVMCAGLVLAGAGMVTTVLLGVVISHRRAVAAADLAALSAASRVSDPPWRACVDAAGVAEANQARLTSCEVSGETVTVTVVVRRPQGVVSRLLVPETAATARAGVEQLPGVR